MPVISNWSVEEKHNVPEWHLTPSGEKAKKAALGLLALTVAVVATFGLSKDGESHAPISAEHVAFNPNLGTNAKGDLEIIAHKGDSSISLSHDYADSPDNQEDIQEAVESQERTVNVNGFVTRILDESQGVKIPRAEIQHLPQAK